MGSAMKILMITPGVDESQDLLGFTTSWIRELAKRVDMLYVITPNFDPDTPLPENAIVYGLNERSNKLTKYLYLSRVMVKLLSRKQVDVIFCHMGPNSVLWAAPWAKLFRVPIVTWYSHPEISWRFRIAHLLTNKVVTASEESCNITSNKVIITGHGIDTDMFKPAINQEKSKDKKVILSLGRISPIKDYEPLIEAANILINKKGLGNLEFIIVGGTGLISEQQYYQLIRDRVNKLSLQDYVKFLGPVSNKEAVGYYQACDVFVNMQPTGGLGKAVLEAMACEKPVVVCSEPYRELLQSYGELYLFKPHDPESMAEKLANLILNERMRPEIGKLGRQKVVESHSISQLADKLVNIFAALSKHKETGRRG